MTQEEFIDEGYAVVEYPGGFTYSKTRTIYSLENGKLKADVVGGEIYTAMCVMHMFSFLFQNGFKLC